MNSPTSLAEALLGLDGFQILGVHEASEELITNIETRSTVVGCPTCGVRAQARSSQLHAKAVILEPADPREGFGAHRQAESCDSGTVVGLPCVAL